MLQLYLDSQHLVKHPLSPDGMRYGLMYERLVPVLVNAVKELSAKNDALAAEVEQLKSQLNN